MKDEIDEIDEINKIDQIECIENLSSYFDEMGKKKYMKEQITDFNDIDMFKINFRYCHISISKNGGLIAICKKKGFIDVTKGANLSKFIIVMFQNGIERYKIKIDWDYNKRWIVCLDFTKKDDLYGIFNDGSIYKFNFYERKYKETITTETLRIERVLTAKFFEKGFIALTECNNFYIIKDIKSPTAIILCSFLDYVDFNINVDFLPISPDNSSSGKIELLLARQDDKDGGVIQVVQKEEGQNVQFYPINTKWFEIKGAYLILREKPRKLYVNKYEKDKKKKEEKNKINEKMELKDEKAEKKEKIDKKDKKKIIEEEEDDKPPVIEDLGKQKEMGIINALAISPSGKKIAFYNKEEKIAFLMKSDLSEQYQEIKFNYDKENYSEKEKKEIDALLNYEEGCQFLFCGEDILALSRQRFIILSGYKIENSLVYQIAEGGESDVKRGNMFSKCISETDGLRFLTNKGVFLISSVPKELDEISHPFSDAVSRALIRIYKSVKLKRYNSDKDMRSLSNFLPNSIMNLQIACANIFWTDKNNDGYKKEIQFFILKAAQYAKKYVDQEEFNYNKFNDICKEIRIINNLRNDEASPLFITFREYKELDPKDLINRLIKYKNFKLAGNVSKFLDYGLKKVFYKYVITIMKKQIKNIEDSLEKPKKKKGKEVQDENKKSLREKYELLFYHLEKIPGISYIKLAKKAVKYNGIKLAAYLLEQEKSDLIKIPQLLQLNKETYDEPIEIAFGTYDFNAVVKVLKKILKDGNFSSLANQSLQKHFPKIVLYLKKYHRLEYKEKIKLVITEDEEDKKKKEKKEKKSKKDKKDKKEKDKKEKENKEDKDKGEIIENDNESVINVFGEDKEKEEKKQNFEKIFYKCTKNNEELLYIKLQKYFNSQNYETRDKHIKKCKKLLKKVDKDKDFDSKYMSKFLEKCEKVSKFKLECIEDKNNISPMEIEPYNVSVYDCYKKGLMKGQTNWIESENSKHIEYSNKKLNLLKFRTYLEIRKPEAIDNQLEKTPLKKLGLTNLNMGELYYDYKYYDKATKYLLQVRESGNYTYAADMLKSMERYKEALEVIICTKNTGSKLDMVNDIIKKQPYLQKYVDDLCAKNKVNLQ